MPNVLLTSGETDLVVSYYLVLIYFFKDLFFISTGSMGTSSSQPSIVNIYIWRKWQKIVECFTSFQHHILNKHEFPNNIYHKRCEHKALSEDDARRKDWREMGSKSHAKLLRKLCGKTLLADLENMTEQVNTAMLAVFHGLNIAYLPIFFDIEKIITGK